jgi:hypothetical protein
MRREYLWIYVPRQLPLRRMERISTNKRCDWSGRERKLRS